MDKKTMLWLWAIGVSIFIILLLVLYAISGSSNMYELNSWIWMQILDKLL